MSTTKQVFANRLNALRSTGPITPEGQRAAAVNSVTHGLAAAPETLFAAQPAEEFAFNELARRLRRDCVPDSELEEEAFQQYAWSTFQARRARVHETLTENRWLEDPDDSKRFSQMERTLKLGAMLERRASKALKQLQNLQRDRFAAYEVYAEHCVMGNDVPIPKSLPTAEIRKSDMGRTNPNYIAQFLLYQTKDVKDKAKEMLAAAKIKQAKMKETNEANPPANPLYKLSMDELMALAKAAGIKA